ncbi:MAG: hypothetical protein AB4062_08495 [Crocosphaera sp.]
MAITSFIENGEGVASFSVDPTKFTTPGLFLDTVTSITGIDWTLWVHARQIPTCRFWQ